MGNRTCMLPSCDSRHFGKGYCSVHYQRWRRYGDPAVGMARASGVTRCSIENCDQANYGRGLCSMHYARWKTHGDPLRISQKAKTVSERFWEKVDVGGVCWEWTGTKVDGYGHFWDGASRVGAHRWAWLELVGPIASGLHLDHLCRNRACVNPDHLEPVDQRTNVLRGNGAAARAARRKASLAPR